MKTVGKGLALAGASLKEKNLPNAKHMTKPIKENVDNIRARVEMAARRSGRDAARVRLLAATKNRSAGQVLEAGRAGIEVVGENRAQEMLAKYAEVGDAVEWHFIGHLQRNKVRPVAGIARMIHSVDSMRLAVEIDRESARIGRMMPILLQVNMAGEESKFGLEPDECADLVGELEHLENIELRGLSTIAPLAGDPEQVRWVFAGLRRLGKELEREGHFRCDELSMGMTGDFEVAVEEGSTIVRIGTAIFS